MGRSNDERKGLVCVTWEKLVPSPFLILYCGSAMLDMSLGIWRASTLGAHLLWPRAEGEMAGSHCAAVFFLSFPKDCLQQPSGLGVLVCTSRSPLGKVLKGLFPMG